ncbi:hypothetical protein HDV05_004462 [Chytridiales sp. JEL 0842]|nr:hypothetical protein HDV05_004462 [Chytridiales sp. JEL 0842]
MVSFNTLLASIATTTILLATTTLTQAAPVTDPEGCFAHLKVCDGFYKQSGPGKANKCILAVGQNNKFCFPDCLYNDPQNPSLPAQYGIRDVCLPGAFFP